MKKKCKKAFLYGVVVIGAFWLGGLGLGQEKNAMAAKKTQVKKLQLSKKQYVLKKGKTVKLKASILPKSAKKTKVIWRSSNSKLLRVNKKGVVKAKGKKGSAVISAKAGKKKTTCKITIGKPVSKLGANDLKLQVNQKKRISVTIFPEKASIKKLSYQCNRPELVSISKNGTVLGKKKGSAIITIWAADCMKVFKKIKVVVSEEKEKSNQQMANEEKKPSQDEEKDGPGDTETIKPTPSVEENATGNLAGTVKGRQNSTEASGLEGAEVTVYQEKERISTVKTAAGGGFEITGLDCGKKYTVVIQKEGFRSLEIQEVSVKKDSTTGLSETGILTLLSQSVQLMTHNEDVVKISEEGVKIPEDIESQEFLKVLYNPEGGSISLTEDNRIQVQAEDSAVVKDYPIQFVQREKALVSGTDYTVDYQGETLQVSSGVTGEVEYRFAEETAWKTIIRTSDTNVYEAISLREALNQGLSLFIRKAKKEEGEFASAEVVVELTRPEKHDVKYYRIGVTSGYRYGIEVGKLNHTYEVYFSTTNIEDLSQIDENKLHRLQYTGTDSDETMYECETYYGYVYVRLVSTEDTFASEWIEAEYKSRDNEFHFDDIP